MVPSRKPIPPARRDIIGKTRKIIALVEDPVFISSQSNNQAAWKYSSSPIPKIKNPRPPSDFFMFSLIEYLKIKKATRIGKRFQAVKILGRIPSDKTMKSEQNSNKEIILTSLVN